MNVNDDNNINTYAKHIVSIMKEHNIILPEEETQVFDYMTDI